MQALSFQLQNSVLRGVLKRLHYPLEVMLVCVRWYAAYPLSLRNLEEDRASGGIGTCHSTRVRAVPTPSHGRLTG